MTSGVYAITNTVSGERYVGSARGIEGRWETHRRLLRAGTHHSKELQRAWNEQGITAFSWQVLEVVPDRAKLREREQGHLDIGRHEYNTAVAHSQFVPKGYYFTQYEVDALAAIAAHLHVSQSSAVRGIIREEWARIQRERSCA